MSEMADIEKDIEKVISGLELCTHISPDSCLMLCPYKDEQDEIYPGFCEEVLKHDAVKIIEEQQKEIERLKIKETPMKPNGIKKHMYDMWKGLCGSCGDIILNVLAYCPHCEQKQDWSDVKKDDEQ